MSSSIVRSWPDLNARADAAGVPLWTLVAPLPVTLLALGWMATMQVTLDWHVLSLLATSWLILAGLTLALLAVSPMRPLPALVGSFCVLLLGLAASSLPSVLGFAGPRVLWDAAFLAADRAMGIRHEDLIAVVTERPWLSALLHGVYFNTVKIIFLLPLLLCALRRYDRLHELLTLFVGSLFAIVAIAAFMPARGLFANITLDPATAAALPAYAGVFHLALVDSLLSGAPIVYNIAENPGVIVFPSFHCCMGLLVVLALRGIPVLAIAGLCAGVAIIVSTIPFGGHYVVDLVGGAAVLLAIAALSRPAATAAVHTQAANVGLAKPA
jgi:hypothetical protein